MFWYFLHSLILTFSFHIFIFLLQELHNTWQQRSVYPLTVVDTRSSPFLTDFSLQGSGSSAGLCACRWLWPILTHPTAIRASLWQHRTGRCHQRQQATRPSSVGDLPELICIISDHSVLDMSAVPSISYRFLDWVVGVVGVGGLV